jgi:hypothetical protein
MAFVKAVDAASFSDSGDSQPPLASCEDRIDVLSLVTSTSIAVTVLGIKPPSTASNGMLFLSSIVLTQNVQALVQSG